MKVRPKVKRIVGLTGTPSSNGLMDLWAEFRLLDMGERLGRFIDQYREIYFKPDKRNGPIIYSYKPLPFAEDAIYESWRLPKNAREDKQWSLCFGSWEMIAVEVNYSIQHIFRLHNKALKNIEI